MVTETQSAELGCKTRLSLRAWSNSTPEIIGRVRYMLHSALRSKGVVTVYQAPPFFVSAYTDEETGEEHEAYWELCASGISLCIRDGHIPFEDSPEPVRSFMCGRCKAITDQDAYEAFAQ